MEVFGLSPTFHVSVPLLVSSSEWPACSLGPPSRKLPPSRSRATQHLCEMTLFAPFARSESYLLRPRRAQIHSLFRTHSVSRVLRSALAHVALLPAAGAVTRCHGPRLLSQGRQEQRCAPTSEAVAPEPKPVTSYQPSTPALQPRAAARPPSRHSCPPLCYAAPASCLQTLPCLVLANYLPDSPRRSHAEP